MPNRLAALVAATLLATTHAFAIVRPVVARPSPAGVVKQTGGAPTPPQPRARLEAPLRAGGGDDRQFLRDSNTRGTALFLFVLAINVWLFSIPPEFRRAEICTTSRVRPGSECTPFVKWAQDIGDYYASGGGVQWDFSIEQK